MIDYLKDNLKIKEAVAKKAGLSLSGRQLKRLLLTLIFLSLISFPGFRSDPAKAELLGWYDSDWRYRKEIAVDGSKVKGEFSDFTLVISLNDPDLKSWADGGHVSQTDGGDILFCDETGKKLGHEIETYQPKEGRLTAWVRLKKISPLKDRRIYLYYGNPNCHDQSSSTSIFEPTLKYLCHMEIKDGLLFDSTFNQNLPKNLIGLPKRVFGLVGGAQEFDGANDYLEFENNLSLGWSENGFIRGEGQLIESFDNSSSWTPLGKGVKHGRDNLNLKEGAASLKLVASRGSTAFVSKKIDLNLSAAKNFTFWVYISERSKVSSISIEFTSTKDWSKKLTSSVTASALKNGWNRVIVGRKSFSTSTGENWASRMVGVRFSLKPASAGLVSANLDELRFNQAGRAKAIISFDDGYDDVKNEAFPIMKANGQRGVAFITSDYIDKVNHMTTADLIAMRDSGWDISNHTRSHRQLTKLSWAEMDDEINGCYDWLVNNGFKSSADIFAYPYGLYNDKVIKKVKEKHKLARSVISGESQAHLLLGGDLNYLIKALNVTNKVSVASVKRSIDEAIAKGSPLVIFMHQIVDEDADKSTQYLTQDFKEISDYLKARSEDIDVITFSDYHERLLADQQLSVEVILKPAPATGYSSALEKYHPSHDKSTYRIASRGGSAYVARLTTHDGSVVSDFGILPTDRYSHLVMTYDGLSLKTYRDGAPVDKKAIKGSLLKNSYPLYIAKRDKRYWQGSLDEIKIYNRALSAEEIATRYNNQGLQEEFYSVLKEEGLW